VGGSTFEELSERLLQVNSVEGIMWTDSAFATYLAEPESDQGAAQSA
jgi:hypothetical protein